MSEKSKAPRVPLKQRLEEHLAEYGLIALVILLTLSALTFTGFFIAIKAGLKSSSSTGLLGTALAAWLASKATLPIRIAATLVLTPIVAAVLPKKKTGATGSAASESDNEPR